MPRLPRFLRGHETPAETPGVEAVSDGRDPDMPVLDIAGGVQHGVEVETAETDRIESELDAAREQLTRTLRAVLAERMVRAPTTEFEAVQVPDKDRLKEAREARRASSARGADGLNPDAVMAARKRLGRRDSSPARGRKKRK